MRSVRPNGIARSRPKKPTRFQVGRVLVVDVQKTVAIRSSSLQEIAHAPDASRDASGHSGRHPERLVDATEIVETEPQRDHRPMVFPLLRESVREACEATDSHANRE